MAGTKGLEGAEGGGGGGRGSEPLEGIWILASIARNRTNILDMPDATLSCALFHNQDFAGLLVAQTRMRYINELA